MAKPVPPPPPLPAPSGYERPPWVQAAFDGVRVTVSTPLELGPGWHTVDQHVCERAVDDLDGEQLDAPIDASPPSPEEIVFKVVDNYTGEARSPLPPPMSRRDRSRTPIHRRLAVAARQNSIWPKLRSGGTPRKPPPPPPPPPRVPPPPPPPVRRPN